MKEFRATLSESGQVTIPAEVLRLLEMGLHDQLAFRIEDGQVRLAPVSPQREVSRQSRPAPPQHADGAGSRRSGKRKSSVQSSDALGASKRGSSGAGHGFSADDVLWQIAGIGHSGLHDVAVNHDHYLADASAETHE